MDKYKITVTIPFGAYASIIAAKTAQKQIKQKSKGIKYTAITKRGNGFVFDGTVTIIEKATATNSQMKASVRALFPTAKTIKVVNLTHANMITGY